MSKLVNFLLEKNITPKDVFDICMGLRRTMVSFLFREKLIEVYASEVITELAILFDANLSGVLSIFTTYYEKKQQAEQRSKIQQKKFSQILKIINFINTKIIIVQNGHIILANQPFLEAIDEWLDSINKSDKPFTANIFNNKMADIFTCSGQITTLCKVYCQF
jgi:hypothetical protein